MRHTNEAVETAMDAAKWSLMQITNYIPPNQSEVFKMHGGIPGRFMSVAIAIERDTEGFILTRSLKLEQVRTDRKPRRSYTHPLFNTALDIMVPATQSFSFEEQVAHKDGQSGVRRRVEVRKGNVTIYRHVTFSPADMDEATESYLDIMPPWDRETSLTQMAADITELTMSATKRRSTLSDDPTFP